MDDPVVELHSDAGGSHCALRGCWVLRLIAPRLDGMLESLGHTDPETRWDLRDVDTLDSAGALILWRAWGRRFPAHIVLRDEHRSLFEKWDELPPRHRKPRPPLPSRVLASLAHFSRTAHGHLWGGTSIVGQFFIDTALLASRPRRLPWREISSTIFHAGAKALGITALVGVLIGIVIAYQAAMQLRMYGGEIFIINILSLSVTRELGPVLAAILVAGRSGSSMTAQLGVMRLNQELDAMTVLGMSVSQRLVFPKVIGLTIALPLVTMWTIILAMLGGMTAANLALGMPFRQFLNALPDTMPLVNLWIGLGKAAVFGALIGLTSAYFGLRVRPNTQSLAAETTRSVVAAVTLVIVLDAIFSVMLQDVGWR